MEAQIYADFILLFQHSPFNPLTPEAAILELGLDVLPLQFRIHQ